MSVFTTISDSVTARDAARLYGLQFSRNGRALCPWHDDHHPDLAFYDKTGTCYCHACHHGGDATALTASLFGLSMMEAAQKLSDDFKLNIRFDHRDKRRAILEQKQRQAKLNRRNDYNRLWSFLCEVVHETDRKLSRFPTGDATWNDPDFLNALKLRSVADQDLDTLWYLGGELQ